MAKLASRIITAFICTIVATCSGGIAVAAKSADIISTDKTQVEINKSTESIDRSSSSQINTSDDVLVSDENNTSEKSISTSAEKLTSNEENAALKVDSKSGKLSALNSDSSPAPSEVQKISDVKIGSTYYHTISNQIPIAQPSAAIWKSAATINPILHQSQTAPVGASALPPSANHNGQSRDLMFDFGGLLSISAFALLPTTAFGLFNAVSMLPGNLLGHSLIPVILGDLAVIVLAIVIAQWKRNRYRGAPRSDIVHLITASFRVIEKIQGSIAVATAPLFDERRYL